MSTKLQWAGTALVFLSAPVWLPVLCVVVLIVAIGAAIIDGFMKLHTELWSK